MRAGQEQGKKLQNVESECAMDSKEKEYVGATPTRMKTPAARTSLTPAKQNNSVLHTPLKPQPSNDKSQVEVAVRIRPSDRPETDLTVVQNSIVCQGKTFSFDRVYIPTNTTEDVFEEFIREPIQSVVKGFNSTVFAYGQTGSGKTHTMIGTPTERGVIFRAVDEVLY